MTYKAFVRFEYNKEYDDDPYLIVLDDPETLLDYEVECVGIPEHMLDDLKAVGEGYYSIYYISEVTNDDGWGIHKAIIIL